ncbi:MAG TPA: polysaccharide biosynthesis tyrosine autokinase, partial [Planctomycetota bacterium]|nr:polysaccharide biosynthesis tyrosine autokinase [Planctomycetota bacterium]
TRLRQERARSRIRALEADEHRFREALPAGNEADSLKSPVLDRVRTEMNKVRSDIALRGLERTPGSPEYKTLAARLAELEDALRAELYRARAETIVSLRESIRDLDDELRELDEERLRKRLEASTLAQELRERSPKRVELETVTRALRDAEVRRQALAARLEEAPRPVEPSRDSREHGHASLGWAAAGILLAALAGALWRDAADPRVRTDADVKRRLNLPAIALVEDAGHDPLIFRRHPQDPLSETMSTAATVLRSYMAEREFRTLAVTSAQAGEGKTTTSMNLACALARKGLNVLLVDADLRAPRLHEIYGIDNSRGLSTLLLGPEPAEPEPDPDQIIIQTEISTLRILPAGPTNEIVADLHDSARMIDFLRTQRERFDLIILDAAPLTGVGDAVALSRVVDTCLWVVRSGSSDRRTLGWAKHLLKTVRADVAGVILNCSPGARGERFYSYAAGA